MSVNYVVDEDDTAWLVHTQDVRIGRNPTSLQLSIGANKTSNNVRAFSLDLLIS